MSGIQNLDHSRDEDEEGTTIPLEATSDNEIKTYKMNEMDFLEHFIILGVSRYSDSNLIVKAIEVLNAVLGKEPKEVDNVIKMVLKISEKGRCNSQDAVFLCMVMCYIHSPVGKAAIYENITYLCRIPTHLFVFLKMLKEYTDRGATMTNIINVNQYYDSILRNRGSAAQLTKSAKLDSDNEGDIKPTKISSFVARHKFIAKWYSDPKKSAQDLLLLLTKYQRRDSWDNKTLIKYSHMKIENDDDERQAKNTVIQYHLHGFKKIENELSACKVSICQDQVLSRIAQYIDIFEGVKKAMKEDDPAGKIAALVEKSKREAKDVFRCVDIQFTVGNPISSDADNVHDAGNSAKARSEKFSRLHLAIEHLPTEMYTEKRVWDELIKDMPMTAMLKHISHISYLGLFDENENIQIIRDAFTNGNRLYPFIHPYQILKSFIAYQKGVSWHKEQKTWSVNPLICDILNDAFFLSLKRKSVNLPFQRCVICIDASQSMYQNGFLGFEKFTAAMASIAVASAIEKVGRNNSIVICGRKTKELKVKTLIDRLGEINECKDEKANLSIPIREAIINKRDVDAFIIFTKSIKEDICGESPYETYKEYKDVMKEANTKLVICSMEANNNVIADFRDPNVKMICGADANILPTMYKRITSVKLDI